jgi:hypothetical protein
VKKGRKDLLRLAFAYATPTTDNGNLTSQTIAAPGFSQTQYYGYDGVNRLKAASEGAALVGGTTCPRPKAGARSTASTRSATAGSVSQTERCTWPRRPARRPSTARPTA